MKLKAIVLTTATALVLASGSVFADGSLPSKGANPDTGSCTVKWNESSAAQTCHKTNVGSSGSSCHIQTECHFVDNITGKQAYVHNDKWFEESEVPYLINDGGHLVVKH